MSATAASEPHKARLPLMPALGAVFTVTFTVAETSGQPGRPGTVYVYAPAVWTPGLNTPPVALGPLHEPPVCGVPPK